MRGAEKITADHRERTAIVYIRQSSLAQVRDNTESTARQYALADEAVRLGWARQQVEVIDADLGLSGRSADRRPGFKDLVGRVCVGEVGAIFGLEVSRLARSSADLSRLLELARLTDTLVIDADGIYDLANFNDRLLLGLEGDDVGGRAALPGRPPAGRQTCRRGAGELRFPLPVGFVYDDDGDTIIDPDAEVQAAVADVFAAFRAGGSAYQVVAAFKGRRFPLRAYGGVWAGQLRWGRLTHSRVLGMLGQPRLCRHLRVRPLPLPPRRQPRRRRVHQDRRAASRRMAGRHPRSPSRLHQLGRLPHQRGPPGRQPDQRRRPPTPRRPRPVPRDHRLRVLRAADDHPLPPQRPRRLRMLGVAGRSDGHAHVPVDHRRHRRRRRGRTTPRRPQPRRGRPWRWPPPTRSPTAGPAAAGPPSWPWNGPATKPNAPNAPSTPANRRTGSSPAASKPAGKPASPPSPKPTRRARRQHAPPPPPLPSRAELRNPHRRRVGPVARPDHLAPRPQTAAAHAHRRCHPAARTRLRQGPHRDPLAHRRHRRARRRPPPRRHPVSPHPSRRHRARPQPRQPPPTTTSPAGSTPPATPPAPAGPSTTTPSPRCATTTRSRRPGCSNDGELTVADIARRLGIGHGAVIHWINRGWLPARRGLNNQWCVPFGPTSKPPAAHRVSRSAHIHEPDPTTRRPTTSSPSMRSPPARHQHQRRLLLDRTPPPRRPPRPRRPPVHQLRTRRRSRLPRPCRRSRSTSSPPHKPQTPQSTSQEAV